MVHSVWTVHGQANVPERNPLEAARGLAQSGPDDHVGHKRIQLAFAMRMNGGGVRARPPALACVAPVAGLGSRACLPIRCPLFLADAPGALLDRDRLFAYMALADEGARLARALRGLGVRPGDRVALWLPNIPAWFSLFFACARLGAIAVSVNTRFKSHEVADIVGRARAKLLCFWPGFRQIDFAGMLAGCDAAALSALEALLVYEETAPRPRNSSANLPIAIAG